MAGENKETVDAGIPQAPTYSKDYWDLVFEQLGKRPLFKIGMAILALLYASAIYALESEPWDGAVGDEREVSFIARAEEGAGGAFNIADVAGEGLRFVRAFSEQDAPTLTYSWLNSSPRRRLRITP